jgi:predicted esterase
VPYTGPDGGQRGLAYVPAGVREGSVRLVLVLHGAGGTARQGLDLLIRTAEEESLLLLAPKSRAGTWDFIAHGYGPDVLLAGHLLDEVAATYPVRGLSVAGFSDGASYALSLGIANGDLFDSVVAFSPGFMAPQLEHGRPRVFVSHGLDDPVLPIDRCSRRLVPRLQRSGYYVTYREFPGAHTVPPEIASEAARWLNEAHDAG